MIERAFYCASSALYFPGAVAMINSLRLQGHHEPIHVLDCGLEPGQRALIEREATIVPMPAEVPPYLLKTVAPLAAPARTMVLIDADMIATSSLVPLIELAGAEGVVAFENDVDRFVAAWGEVLDLGPVRRHPYVSSGFAILAGAVGAEVLGLWDERQRRVDFDRSCFGPRPEPGYPLYFLDQDVLNAVIGARADAGQFHAIEQRLAANPPFDGIELRDERTLTCVYRDGAEPYLLHHFDRKPWVARLRANVYSRLLTRLLLADDVALRMEPEALPTRLRTGVGARMARASTDAVMAVPGAARRIRERLGANRRAGAA